MTTIALPGIECAPSRLIAPRWHTALLVALFLGLAVGGAFFQRHARTQVEVQQQPQVIPLYISLIAMEWGLVIYVSRAGLRRTGTTLKELIGGDWANAKGLLVDCGFALGMWAFWTLLQMGWYRWLGPGRAISIQTYLPRRPLEILLWIGVSLSAGFCEEFVFRGYFQKQFEAITRDRWVAWSVQAVLFGISHGYQGVGACVKITCFGALYGLLAIWRKNLRPGMMAHAWGDILSGIFRF
jgi:uncharacterized protein